jgi:transcriptional regulator with XRE-family HTH domain
MNLLKETGERLRILRERRGLSLEKLAGISHVSKNTINQMEMGQGNPTLKTLIALADTLQTDIWGLLGGVKSDLTSAERELLSLFNQTNQSTVVLDLLRSVIKIDTRKRSVGS